MPEIQRHAVQSGVSALTNIKNCIAIASGKGGVGKSTVAANLALALKQQGIAVGLLDADIYGPSVSHIMGTSGKQADIVDKKLQLVFAHGIPTMSMAYLMPDTETPMVWRGPMIGKALQQLINDTAWPDLDILIIDLPPGTGDIQLTMAQKIPVSGSIIVTTPQDVALLDAQKALKMFEKVNISVLGIIENMAGHVCSACGHVDPIFGEGGGDKLSQKFKTKLLGQVPLDAAIQQQGETGKPIVVADPNTAISKQYISAADTMLLALSARPIDYAHKFGTVVVE